MASGKLIFITGGVRSGKSRFAEEEAKRLFDDTGSRLHYIACGRRTDQEMEIRIQRHQEDRTESEIPWTNWEFPLNITLAAEKVSGKSVVLLDCLTTLLDNELFLPGKALDLEHQQAVIRKILSGIHAIQDKVQFLIVVSNELTMDTAFDNDVLHMYKRLLGLLHQSLVSKANEAYLVESGLPLKMKGGTA